MNNSEYNRWIADKADHLRYEFDLNNRSFVIDAGGYDGLWAMEIFKKYYCRIDIFEPVPEFASKIQNLILHNIKMRCYTSGLSSMERKAIIFLDKNSTSLHNTSDKSIEIQLVSLNGYMEYMKQFYAHVDLLKINIEGEEYNLLDSLIKENNHLKVKNILVQFHPFIEHYDSRRECIHNELKKSHDLVFCYDYIWEHWKIK